MKMKFNAKKLCLAAAFMALNIVLSTFGVPVPGGTISVKEKLDKN